MVFTKTQNSQPQKGLKDEYTPFYPISEFAHLTKSAGDPQSWGLRSQGCKVTKN